MEARRLRRAGPPAAFLAAAIFCLTSGLADAAKPRRVLRVVDGDTLVTREDGSVRLLGLDAFEQGAQS